MKEAQVIARGNMYTVEDLAAQLGRLGVERGDCLCVHTAMSKLGWVCGAEQAVVEALLTAVGAADGGTLIMPAQSGSNTDPADWANPPVPPEWIQRIRDNMPAFHPDKTPTRGMGRVAELFRKWPGAVRSNHPNSSFVACGARAAELMGRHGLAYSLGEDSPCRALYEAGAKVLLLGVPYTNCTIMHLGEYRWGGRDAMRCGAAIMENGQRVWKEYDDIETDVEIFAIAGQHMEQDGRVVIGKVGDAECRLFSGADAVDYTIAALKEQVGG